MKSSRSMRRSWVSSKVVAAATWLIIEKRPGSEDLFRSRDHHLSTVPMHADTPLQDQVHRICLTLFLVDCLPFGKRDLFGNRRQVRQLLGRDLREDVYALEGNYLLNNRQHRAAMSRKTLQQRVWLLCF